MQFDRKQIQLITDGSGQKSQIEAIPPHALQHGQSPEWCNATSLTHQVISADGRKQTGQTELLSALVLVEHAPQNSIAHILPLPGTG